MTPLEEKIMQANIAYWSKHQPIMSDAEYDRLIEQLRKEDPFNPLISKLDDGTKNECVHPYPMLSLRKVYNLEDLKSWVRSVARSDDEAFTLSIKLDGCTCRVTDGRIYTRGDGHAGEDITPILPIIKGIYNVNDLGELVITNHDFTDFFVSGKILCKDGTLYQNQRNAVAGLLGRVENIRSLPRVLTFVSYDNTCPMQVLTTRDIDHAKIEEWVSWAFSFDYPLDGLVIKLADKEYSNSLGNTSHHPRGQIAYKFENESKESEIVDIEWTLGRTGIITPVVKIKEIEIQGSHITSVTAHDAKHVLDMSICVGHKIKVSRAGQVIPFIESVWPTEQSKDKTPVIPRKCPVCGSTLSWTLSEVDLMCINKECKGKLLQSLVYATKFLKMDGWSEQTIKDLFERYPLSLYKLFTLSLEDLKEVFPGKRSDNLFQVKESVLDTITEDKLLAALGIPLVGKENAKEVLQYVTLDDIANNRIGNIPFFQIKLKIKYWWCVETNPLNLKLIMDFLSERQHRPFGKNLSYSVEEAVSKTVCFTGKMDKTRSEMEEEGRRRGYEPLDTVTKNLDVLVTNDLNGSSSKLKKAREYGTKIMSVQDFMEISYI